MFCVAGKCARVGVCPGRCSVGTSYKTGMGIGACFGLFCAEGCAEYAKIMNSFICKMSNDEDMKESDDEIWDALNGGTCAKMKLG